MPILPPAITWPAPGSFVSYWSTELRRPVYMELIDRRVPLVYPRRLASVAPGNKTDLFVLDELDPAVSKRHIYALLIGCYPESLVHLWHPYDVKHGAWDQRITSINENLVATISYAESPHDAPTKSIWVLPDRYPGIEVRNVGRQTAMQRVFIIGAEYSVVFDDELSSDTKNGLQSGAIPSLPVDVGGEG